MEIAFVIFGVCFAIALLVVSNSSNEKKEVQALLDEHSLKLDELEIDLSKLTRELSKWVYSCKKCQHNSFIIGYHTSEMLNYLCVECNKIYELKSKNAFYNIDVIPKIHEAINQLNNLILDESLHGKLMTYLQHHYEFKHDYAPKTGAGYLIYDFYFNKRKNKYLSLKYTASKKSFNLITNHFLATRFYSDGSMLDKIEEKKNKAEMGKLNPNRPALSVSLEEEWNYKSITSGKKSTVIKKWAKSTSQKCPDGRKCGGVKLNELPLKDIAYGHIISQSFSKTFPHLHDKVHHPDNLYLTCKSCNSSLGGKNADDELINRIKNESGTIGDWLRNYIKEIESIPK